MAIKIFEKFTPRANPADADYPYGSIKNESVPGAKDGTPLDAAWGNDYVGSDAELLAQAGIVPSGVPDKLGASQRVDAIKVVAAKLLQYVGGGGAIGANIRDTFLVSRTLSALTDCHAFADKTVISNATDSGTYGTFDATTEIAGSHSQSHQFSFQDRAKFSGSGQITTWGNIIWPEHTGTGHIGVRYNWDIKDVNVTDGGTVGTNIGINIRDLQNATSNTAIGILQSSGYSVYAPNAGAWLIGGAAQINGTATHKGTSLFEGTNYLGGATKVGGYANGTAPLGGTALTVEKNGLTTQGFVDVNSLGLSFGVAGDYKIQFVSAAISRFTIGNAAEGYDIYPYAATQKLGRANNPFAAVVLKDTANGNSYKLQVTNGVLAISLA